MIIQVNKNGVEISSKNGVAHYDANGKRTFCCGLLTAFPESLHMRIEGWGVVGPPQVETESTDKG